MTKMICNGKMQQLRFKLILIVVIAVEVGGWTFINREKKYGGYTWTFYGSGWGWRG